MTPTQAKIEAFEEAKRIVSEWVQSGWDRHLATRELDRRISNLSYREVNPSNDFTGFVDQGQYVLDILK